MSSIEEIRREFPQLGEKVYNKPLVYLDNAATSLRPRSVIAKWDEMSSRYSANLHRAVHAVANRATEEFEAARQVVADFIGAPSAKEIVFTSGTTHALNLLAFSLGEQKNFLRPGDEIIIGEEEHHSNILPWQFLAERKLLKIKVLPVDERGALQLGELPRLVSGRTRICCIAQVSNVLGLVNPVREIASFCHSHGVILIVDGAQGAVHCKTDVKDLGADFYVFSGHKLYAAPGTGVLWGKKALLEMLPPYMGGGEMIRTVKWNGSTFAPVPHKFEAGTVSAGDAVGMAAAIRYIQSVGLDTIEKNDNFLADKLMEGIKKIPHFHIVGGKDGTKRCGIVTFTVDDVHPHDIATLLSDENIAIRAGHHCAQPLQQYLGIPASARASLYFYNTEEEVDTLLSKLPLIRKWSGFKD